jgi:hypothetical protein
MENQRYCALLAMGLTLMLVNSVAVGQGSASKGNRKQPDVCHGGRCIVRNNKCCSISDYFQTNQFENLFSKRNSPVAHELGFWDYHSFITASDEYQPYGFGTTDGNFLGLKEVAAFLAHVGSKTSCEFRLFPHGCTGL